MDILNEIENIGAAMMNRSSSSRKTSVFHQRWRAHFGASPKVIKKVWELLDVRVITHLEYLLWCLMFLKIYPKENVACSLVGGIDEKTWRKKIWPLIEAIALLEDKVVS